MAKLMEEYQFNLGRFYQFTLETSIPVNQDLSCPLVLIWSPLHLYIYLSISIPYENLYDEVQKSYLVSGMKF